jgi:WD40 repeat protein
MTIKVWDCETGVCLRTLSENAASVASLAIHPNGQYFASGSFRMVRVWSSETFEVLHSISFPKWIDSLVFDESDTLYVGVYGQEVVSCNVLTGEVGPVVTPATESIRGLVLGKSPLFTL